MSFNASHLSYDFLSFFFGLFLICSMSLNNSNKLCLADTGEQGIMIFFVSHSVFLFVAILPVLTVKIKSCLVE